MIIASWTCYADFYRNSFADKVTEMTSVSVTRSLSRCFLKTRNLKVSSSQSRSMTHYPIDDRVNGLTDEQKQLRETIFSFCQKELAPHADAIDKANDFPQMRDFTSSFIFPPESIVASKRSFLLVLVFALTHAAIAKAQNKLAME